MEGDESQSLEHVLISYKHQAVKEKQIGKAASSFFKSVFQMQGHVRIEIYSMTDLVLRVMFY